MPGALRRLRFPVEEVRGRRYPEQPHRYRNEFQRDRDRIIHSRAFRRLEYKTQVFTPGISDHFRNRLTHTIEVAQVARTVASTLELDEDFTEALALVHDIGHPPFAHSGEAELNRQMQRFGEEFDHNSHALRIVEHFEHRYARFPGLNLTFEVREGILKHSRDLTPGDDTEAGEYLPEFRPPLEAQLIDLADEIAYNTADLDDAYSAGLIRLDVILARVPLFDDVYGSVEMSFPGADERLRFHESLRLLFDDLVSGLIEGTLSAADQARAESCGDVRRHPTRLASFTPAAEAANRALKKFLHGYVYNSIPLAEARDLCQSMIAELFEHYLEDPVRLPEPYKSQVSRTPPHRVICDYIAGMTDPFLRRTFEETRRS